MIVKQLYSSANTSINSKNLPASTKYIAWNKYIGKCFLDYGGGKFNNLRNYLKENYNINLFIYDKFNRTQNENIEALSSSPSGIICNNVLNVIREQEIIDNILAEIASFNVIAYFSIYNGDKSGIGKTTKSDCYQRNQTTKEYIPMIQKFFKYIYIKNGIIIAKN